ncbi:MAG: PstS family phosphate ABC transporter substrate-binding protein [Myxococcales bacterium]|nr:PstS family phosphate ABC transporter substrate-binding protein [Myxococcales bacterium]
MLWTMLLLGCGRRVDVLQDKGSDTMVNLMQRLSETYLQVDREVVVAVTGGGSGTGIKSLIDGTTDMANASRSINAKELEQAAANGADPIDHVLAYDGLAVYVNADNPVRALSFEELKCIYAADGGCDHWSDLGVTLDCAGSDEILKVGRQNNSGTYEYFREEVVGKHEKMARTMDQSGTQQVVDVVSTATCAIGYGGMGYHAATARFVCLAREKGGGCSEPTVENVASGSYDFSRPLHVYTNGEPDPEVADFLSWARSPDGQQVVLESGFVPLPEEGT